MHIKKSTKRILELIVAGTLAVGNPLVADAPTNTRIIYDLKTNHELIDFLSSGNLKFQLYGKKPYTEELKSGKKSEYVNKARAEKYIRDALRIVHPPSVINTEFVLAKMRIESGFDRYAKSKVGARGLLQIMKSTWGDFETRRSFEKFAYNPQVNTEVGIRQLSRLAKEFERDYSGWNMLSESEKQRYIAAAYNVGYTRLKNSGWDIDKMPRETRNHVKKLDEEYKSNP